MILRLAKQLLATHTAVGSGRLYSGFREIAGEPGL